MHECARNPLCFRTLVIASALLRLLQRLLRWRLLLLLWLLVASGLLGARCLHCSVSFSLFCPPPPPQTPTGSLLCRAISRAALLPARHVRRWPRAVRMCGPFSTRIHSFRYHVMCLFDTWLSTCSEFSSFFSFFFSFALLPRVHSSLLLPSPWASTSLS